MHDTFADVSIFRFLVNLEGRLITSSVSFWNILAGREKKQFHLRTIHLSVNSSSLHFSFLSFFKS